MRQKQENTSEERSIVNSAAQTKFNQLNISNNRQNQYYAPFLAKAKRFASCKYIHQNPPIGAYNFPSCFDKKKSPLQDKVSHFILEAQKKKEQMCIFKSSFNRFEKVKKQIPGPASYNLFKIGQGNLGQKYQKKNIQIQRHSADLVRTCPSIPFKENRYGYAIADGKFKTIEKNQQQLERQKQSRKQYVQTLAGQKVLNRESQQGISNSSDLKKKLYDSTQKVIIKQQLFQNQSLKSNLFVKKPKIQHLYSSKGVPVDKSHQELGPGQYQPQNSAFKTNYKNEKFQFFGSTEVRFRDRTNDVQKGYSLIEMIKQNKKLSQKQRKSPIKKPVYQSSQKNFCKQQVYPGPGQYNPSDQLKKKVRGNTFFPHSQRFKQMYPERKEQDPNQDLDSVKQNQRKNIRTGNLKKDRFKPMHKVYDPVQSSQIRGVLTHHRKNEPKKQSKGRVSKLGFFESQQINSWSSQDRKNKNQDNCYMKQLKQQLAFINDTPKIQNLSTNIVK